MVSNFFLIRHKLKNRIASNRHHSITPSPCSFTMSQYSPSLPWSSYETMDSFPTQWDLTSSHSDQLIINYYNNILNQQLARANTFTSMNAKPTTSSRGSISSSSSGSRSPPLNKRKATHPLIPRSSSISRKQRLKGRAPPGAKPRVPTRLPRPQRQAAESPRGADRPMASQAPGSLLLLHQADNRGAEAEGSDR